MTLPGGFCRKHGMELLDGVGPQWIVFAVARVAGKAIPVAREAYETQEDFKAAVEASPSGCMVCFLDHPQWIKETIDFTLEVNATFVAIGQCVDAGAIVLVSRL